MDLININDFSSIIERNIVNRFGVPRFVNIGDLLSLSSLWLYDDVEVVSFFQSVPYTWMSKVNLIVTTMGNFHYNGDLTDSDRLSLFLKVCNYSCEGKRYKELISIKSDDYYQVLCQVLRNVIVESSNQYHNKLLGNVCMPAFGYHILPEHSEKRYIVSHFDPHSKYVKLTSSYMMCPESSICGLVIGHAV